ncbi:MAG TPA: Hsp20 family protein [Sphingomonadales bacterium]|nr:Hsp20 family protein [Sphingomonadales bacterium]
MRNFDFSPLMQSAIGFDELFRLADSFGKGFDAERSYPPYNIERRGEDGYRITMALAGFKPEDVKVTLEDDTLTVTGETKETEEEETREFIHRGIASRAFVRKFQLADSVRVTGANFDNGLLHIALQREIPEHKKPREIAIETGKSKPAIEGKKTPKAA